MLEWSPKSKAFQRDPANPVEADLVIIDEASMLDTLMTFSLLCALPAQLPARSGGRSSINCRR